MTNEIEAVYKSGSLHPLQPLNLQEDSKVRLSISTVESTPPLDRDLTDYELLAYATAHTAALSHIPTLEEVQQALSAIDGSMAEFIIGERGEY